MRLIQFIGNGGERKVGIVGNDNITLIAMPTVYELFRYADQKNISLEDAAVEVKTNDVENYERLVQDKRLLLPLDHPDPYRLWVTGTGLTHLGSAVSRNKMHEAIQSAETLTDSMKMFRMGEENGKMKNNIPASQPEWFYKGNGLIAVPPGHSISSPSFALDGGEEPEIAGLYIINKKGNPVRIGFALGNEFSDHVMEKINRILLFVLSFVVMGESNAQTYYERYDKCSQVLKGIAWEDTAYMYKVYERDECLIGALAPDFTAKTMKGQQIQLSKLKGWVIVPLSADIRLSYRDARLAKCPCAGS